MSESKNQIIGNINESKIPYINSSIKNYLTKYTDYHLIHSRIEKFIKKYQNHYEKEEFDDSTKEIINNNMKYLGNINNFSRKIVKNYSNKNQFVYNYIVSCSINKIITYLELKKNVFRNKINDILKIPSLQDIKITINNKIRKELKFKEYYYKLIYIFFYYLGFQRQIIHMLQENFNNSSFRNYIKDRKKFGILNNDIFIFDGSLIMDHPLLMPRFENYYDRLTYNLNKLSNELHNIKIYLVFPRDLVYFYEESKNIFILINYFPNDLSVSYISNKTNNLESRIYLLNLLCYCLKRLDELKNYQDNLSLNVSVNRPNQTNFNFFNVKNINSNPQSSNRNLNYDTNISLRKDYILLFYYVFIFLMAFMSGTASIAEIGLYSLWKFYIGENLKINNNILLDVEAMTTNFDTFKNNCFNIDPEQPEYTPYLILS